MGIDRGRGITGEMFAAAENPLAPQTFVKRAGQLHDLFDILSVTTATQGIVRLVIERNIEDWTEIEIEAEQPQEPPGDFAVTPDERYIAAIAKLLGIRRLVSDQSES